MTEEMLLKNIDELDVLLSKCTNPALNRMEHDAIRQVMQTIKQRVSLSYKLEKEAKESKKEEVEN